MASVVRGVGGLAGGGGAARGDRSRLFDVDATPLAQNSCSVLVERRCVATGPCRRALHHRSTDLRYARFIIIHEKSAPLSPRDTWPRPSCAPPRDVNAIRRPNETCPRADGSHLARDESLSRGEQPPPTPLPLLGLPMICAVSCVRGNKQGTLIATEMRTSSPSTLQLRT